MQKPRSGVSIDSPGRTCNASTWHDSQSTATWHDSQSTATWHTSQSTATWHDSQSTATWNGSQLIDGIQSVQHLCTVATASRCSQSARPGTVQPVSATLPVLSAVSAPGHTRLTVQLHVAVAMHISYYTISVIAAYRLYDELTCDNN